ncbi:hypothetical protein FNV43_RR27286 [Rhamnella rubrinervis]|uniref:Reverse transcriptase zinc-binding domain-containing protein n=1 Tax=Rhamnella rubrinervis TaxID=2594499 RepID=A0A8K0DLC6_9ROSA|nr:hypothetical protein FNV43_RR27286 [Rhamnella rubrinervis]
MILLKEVGEKGDGVFSILSLLEAIYTEIRVLPINNDLKPIKGRPPYDDVADKRCNVKPLTLGLTYHQKEAQNPRASTCQHYSSTTWAWKCLLHGYDIIKKHDQWRIGNGNLISQWTDNWGPEDMSAPRIAGPLVPLLHHDPPLHYGKLYGQFKQHLRFAIWQALHNGIATRNNLYCCNMGCDGLCSLCREEKETLEHPFFTCNWVKALWFASFDFCMPPDGPFAAWLQDVITQLLMDKTHTATRVENGKPNSTPVISSKKIKWKPPIQGTIKLNCDGALNSRTKQGAARIVARNWKGEIMCHRFVLFLGNGALTSEGQAVYHALMTGR